MSALQFEYRTQVFQLLSHRAAVRPLSSTHQDFRRLAAVTQTCQTADHAWHDVEQLFDHLLLRTCRFAEANQGSYLLFASLKSVCALHFKGVVMCERMALHKVVGKLIAYLGCFNSGLRIGKMLLYQTERSSGEGGH